MGTQGLYGFYYNGKYYLVYNHYDSYPDGLGNNLIDEIKYALETNRFEQWKRLLIACKVVTDDDVPTQNDIDMLRNFTNLSVSSQKTDDWYCLTREIQGSFISILDSGYIYTDEHYKNKLVGDIFIEYSYVLDFDQMIFKIYTSDGFINSIKLNLDTLDNDWSDLLKKLKEFSLS
jgi:hypothetical protein